MPLNFDPIAEPGAALPPPLPPLLPYPMRDGLDLPVRCYPGNGDAGALLLLHGSGYHSSYLGFLASELARRGSVTVYTPDLRGHGRSPARRGDIDYIDQLEDDLADLLAHLRRRHDGARLFVGGHSSGGGLALRFAGGRYGAQAQGYVLIAPYLGHDAPTTRPNSGGWARPHLATLVALSLLNGFGIRRFNHRTTVEFNIPEQVRDGTETARYSYTLTRGFAPRNWQRDFAGASAPMLCLVAGADEAFLPAAYAPALGGFAGVEVEHVAEASHLGIVTRPQCVDAIGRWIARRA